MEVELISDLRTEIRADFLFHKVDTSVSVKDGQCQLSASCKVYETDCQLLMHLELDFVL